MDVTVQLLTVGGRCLLVLLCSCFALAVAVLAHRVGATVACDFSAHAYVLCFFQLNAHSASCLFMSNCLW